MSFDGGFGAAVFVREALINDVVRAMHFRHGDEFRAALSHTLQISGHAGTISGALFVEAPHVTLRKADGKARVALAGWARVRVQANGIDEVCLARLTAGSLVPLVLDASDRVWNTLYLDLSQFSIGLRRRQRALDVAAGAWPRPDAYRQCRVSETAAGCGPAHGQETVARQCADRAADPNASEPRGGDAYRSSRISGCRP